MILVVASDPPFGTWLETRTLGATGFETFDPTTLLSHVRFVRSSSQKKAQVVGPMWLGIFAELGLCFWGTSFRGLQRD